MIGNLLNIVVEVVGKLFERIVKRRLETHLSRNPEGISGNQFGFRRGRSTIDAIVKVLDIVNRKSATKLNHGDAENYAHGSQ